MIYPGSILLCLTPVSPVSSGSLAVLASDRFAKYEESHEHASHQQCVEQPEKHGWDDARIPHGPGL